MQAKFRMFGGTLTTWESLFQGAADFASRIGPERLINISHSDNHGRGIVVVWYWSEAPAAAARDEARENG